ncbi:MAG: hypothetical protein PVJ38_03925 [Candidatus Bathyarchaeota archaeon]|jgi:hypothetical protein
MVGDRGKQEAWLLLVIAVSVNALIVYGFMSRPIVSYHLSTPLGYNETIDLAAGDLIVTLEASNTGRAPAWVGFVVRLYNASLAEAQDSAVEDVSQVSIPLEGPVPPGGGVNRSISLTTSREASYLVLIFSLEGRRDQSALAGFYSSFTVLEPERPTALLLKRIDGLNFKRVTKR